MQELIQQIFREARSALRFRWQGMALAWLVCAAGWTWAALQPDVYEANARVFVDTSSVLEPVLGNQIVSTNVEAELAYIREALLGQSQLETVARGVGIDAGAVTAQERASVVDSLQRTIQINSTGGNRSDQTYSISYRHENRETAVAVVSMLLDAFMEDALGQNRRGSDTAERFLDERVREYETRLARAEQALADFKKENAERLPGKEGNYFDRMQAERDALATARRDLRILQSKKQQIEEQLSGQSPVVNNAQGDDAQLPPNSLDARIRDLETRLDTALLEYTERHPDVVAMRESLRQLRQQREEQLAALGVEGGDQALTNLGANPVYQALRISLNETEVEIATLRADIQEREAKVEELQGLIDEVPQVEAELARLNRDYDVIYQQYQDLVRSRETQELTRKAADTDQIDFRVINPPMAGFAPVAPPRLMLLAGVLVFSLGAGGGLSYVLAQLWPVFSSARALRLRAELPVLGTVTHAWQDRHRAQVRRATFAYGLALAALVGVFGALAATELVGPGLHDLIGG